MVKTQVLIPEKDFYKVHQKLCNISGFARAVISNKTHTIEHLLATLEAVKAEATEALVLLEEDESDECE